MSLHQPRVAEPAGGPLPHLPLRPAAPAAAVSRPPVDADLPQITEHARIASGWLTLPLCTSMFNPFHALILLFRFLNELPYLPFIDSIRSLAGNLFRGPLPDSLGALAQLRCL